MSKTNNPEQQNIYSWRNRSYSESLTVEDDGKTVTLAGWIDAVRDHGHLLFAHIRDIQGVIQLVFDPTVNADTYAIGQKLRSEFVVQVVGKVAKRSDESINPNLPTGAIEIVVSQIEIVSQALTPPFMVSEKDVQPEGETHRVDEDLRLQYRYLDLRRPSMRDNMLKRSQLTKLIRDHLVEHGFHDLETPMLTKSTPEGARDYLVPSRHQAGTFYALPQSPQLFKQLFMMSGLERYYQIVKCFRDEDLRPNRQPEFTQLDIEASFIDEAFIYELMEELMVKLYQTFDIKLETPFPKITYDEAMNCYGNDHPDLRFDMALVDVSDVLTGCDYKIFNGILSKGGLIKGFNIKGQAPHMSKSLLQNEFAMKVIPKLGAKGMSWMKVEDGKLVSNIVQFFSEDQQQNLMKRMEAEDGDVLIFVADTNHALVHDVLGRFRLHIADYCGLIDPSVVAPCWVVDFPLFEEKDGHLSSMHHPFTQPDGPLPPVTDKDSLLNLKSRAYDLVINGEEVGGGSMRIHDSHMQQDVFTLLGLSEEDIHAKFGFFNKALQYGTPPHGGIALGIDRLMSILLKTDSIREVIAFPKNRVAFCPLTQAPSHVSADQLTDLNLSVIDLED